MAKQIGSKMTEFDLSDLALPEINLLKYVNQKVMWKFMPRNVQRMVEALVAKGEYTLHGIILKKVDQEDQEIFDEF